MKDEGRGDVEEGERRGRETHIMHDGRDYRDSERFGGGVRLDS